MQDRESINGVILNITRQVMSILTIVKIFKRLESRQLQALAKQL